MTLEPHSSPDWLTYRPNLDRIQEAVISSHFMHQLCRDSLLVPYDDVEFLARSVVIPASLVSDRLLPALVRASALFARERAAAARRRAVDRHASYGVRDPHGLGPAEFITEVMFDRQFRRGPRETCARHVLRDRIAQRIAAGAPIEMAIPALPYKFSCPLKTRGQRPDLSEANFLLALYEIAAAVEVLYREARSDLPGALARFTVISDGNRFNLLVNEPDAVVDAYRGGLADWRQRLQLDDHIELADYRSVLRDRLPGADLDAKAALRERALRQYSDTMWPIFDPCNMAATLRAAARLDPDPELSSPDGRFVSLLKSLVFIVKYRSLERYRALSHDRFRGLYRELTGHLFEPFEMLSVPDTPRAADASDGSAELPTTASAKEQLRRAMLREVWSATIAYIAEIKSDRELTSEPIGSCLPDHVRWTIHAKPGQLGLLTSTGLGMPVQAWAGAAAFKRAGDGGIRLCTIPVLALEGAGAIPVRSDDDDSGQPLFYIYPDVGFTDIADFIAGFERRLVRKRVS